MTKQNNNAPQTEQDGDLDDLEKSMREFERERFRKRFYITAGVLFVLWLTLFHNLIGWVFHFLIHFSPPDQHPHQIARKEPVS